MILVAVRDAAHRDSLRAALQREGWQVSVVGSLDSAYRMAADQAPQLVVLDADLPGSEELVKVFARGQGGPGILLLADGEAGERFPAADAVVDREAGGDALVASVRLCLAAPRPAPPPTPDSDDRRWTAEELFGEILEDLDAAVSAVAAAAPGRSEATPAALERGTVPAETLAAPSGGRRPPGPPVAVERPTPQTAPELDEEATRVAYEEPLEAAHEEPTEAEEEAQADERLEAEEAMAAAVPADAEAVPASPPEPTPPSPSGAPGGEEGAEMGPAPALWSPFELPPPSHGASREAGQLEALADELLGLKPGGDLAPPPALEPAMEEPAGPPAVPEGEPGSAPPVEQQPVAEAQGRPGAAAAEPVLGPYRLVELTGSRDGAEVWEALWEGPEAERREVRLEIHRGLARQAPDVAARALAAAERTALLEHPTIETPLDAGLVGEDLFVAGEPVTGTTLERILAAVRALEVRIPLGLALAMGERLATALEQAHGTGEGGVVHGALHPGNVLVTRAGEVKVGGFGVAAALEGDEPLSAGKLRYRAPEQLAGEVPDARGDLYSFGALLFEMVTGRPAFGGEEAAAVAHAVQHDAPDPPDRIDPTIPAEVSGLVARLLKRRRDERVQGAGEAQRKLDLALQALPSPPGPAELAAWIRQLEEAMRHARPRPRVVERPVIEPEVAPSAAAPSPPQPADLERSRRWLVAAILAAGLAAGAVAYWLARFPPGGDVIRVPPPAPRPGSVVSLGEEDAVLQIEPRPEDGEPLPPTEPAGESPAPQPVAD